jgi:hypothetical protein
MDKRPQDSFRRLAIVARADGKRPQQPGPRWLAGSVFDRSTQEKFKPLRMAVMPTLSRGLWIEVLASVWNFLRSYFIAPSEPRPHAAVILPFRRAANDFVAKKASGSVRWNNDRKVAPQEGGRG